MVIAEGAAAGTPLVATTDIINYNIGARLRHRHLRRIGASTAQMALGK
jgi:hypothetical protein